MLNSILFYIFSILLLSNSLLAIFINNAIYSVLFLILSFLMSVSLLFLLESEFMGLIFIVIYVGAIAVLFLFVIMMLNIKIQNSVKDIIKYFPIANFLGFVFGIEILLIVFEQFNINPYNNSDLFNYNINWYEKIDSSTDIESLGQILYTFYVPQFLIAGFILLIAIMGAVALTLNYVKINVKTQDNFRQVTR